MDTTFAEIKRKVLRLAGDDVIEPASGDTSPLAGAQIPADLLQDGVHAALDAICNRYPKSNILECTDTSLLVFDLPVDLIEVEGVYDAYHTIFMPELQVIAGESGLQVSDNAWDTLTENKITFQNTLSSSVRVYYSGMWAKPVLDTDKLEPSAFAINVICLYAAHYVLFYSAAQAGGLAQYKTKVDSGQPTDNPVMDLVNFLLKHYEIEMQRIPMKQKGRKV